MADKTTLQISFDTSDVTAKLNIMRMGLSPARMNEILFWICDKTGRKVKKIMKNDLPPEYVAPGSWVGKAVQSPHRSGVGCIVPIKSTKATIGGKTVKAQGGVAGWEALKYAGKPYPIYAKILAGSSSQLPKQIDGFAPFRNTSAGKLHGAVFVRTSKNRFPIKSVSALAVPQMPLNRSEDLVTNDLIAELGRQVDYYLPRVFNW